MCFIFLFIYTYACIPKSKMCVNKYTRIHLCKCVYVMNCEDMYVCMHLYMDINHKSS